jgi:hypothetical protein
MIRAPPPRCQIVDALGEPILVLLVVVEMLGID